MKKLTLCIPDELAADLEVLAKEQGKTRSEVMCEQLRRYVLMARFREAQREVTARAEALGIGPEDAERLVDEVRAEMRAEGL